jgi:DNA mismatch repair protein MutS2
MHDVQWVVRWVRLVEIVPFVANPLYIVHCLLYIKMLYPNTLEQKLGFDKIRELLRQACISPLGQDYVDKIRFTDNHQLIDKLLRQTYEFTQIVQYEADFPQRNYLDVRTQLQKARVVGITLMEDEFFDLKLALKTIQDCLRFLEKQEEGTYPYLTELAAPVTVDKQIIAALDKVIDDRGKVRDNASPTLADIRRRIISERLPSANASTASSARPANRAGFPTTLA